MQIVLLGYMGSGKSTIGRLLAENLAISFVDLDAYIEETKGEPITSIFKEKGEVYFRKKEAESLREILDLKDDLVLSIGGGTPCYANNMKVIVEKTENAFYLKVPIPELVERLSVEKEDRPLIKNITDDELHEFIGKHLFERSFFYSQATNQVACDGKSPEEVMMDIKELLR